MSSSRRIGALVALIFTVVSCSSPSATNAPATPTAPATSGHRMHPHDTIGGGTGKMSLNLGDAALPNGSNISAIDLGIDAIYVTDASGNQSTVVQNSSPQVVNVLNYQNGKVTSIGSGNVPTATYASLTIVVDVASSNIVTASGAAYKVAWMGAASKSSADFGATTSTVNNGNGSVSITYAQPFSVLSGIGQTVDVDFNAFESLVPIASSTSMPARASLSVASESMEGMIAGSVANASGVAVQNAVVVATDSNGNAVASGFSDANGNFLLHTLAGGTYTLVVYNNYRTATGLTLTTQGQDNSSASFAGPSVTVQAGQTTHAGTIAD